ncbi:MAG: arylsulfatase [Carboxylicivirga sp.]|nr:arylsulfatase [Carboxylicivirga sp.]
MRFRLLFLFCLCTLMLKAQENQQPNVILIMTDDQGYGDLGYHGNPHIKTPQIDDLAKESVRLNNFRVSPVCAPTRASLMTGRYSLRTGVRDTYNGGAIMSPDEITIAELLQEFGYQTAIFGKWHLGDNYPTRPMDQGFQESLVHLAGGIGQAGDWLNYDKEDSSYFNPGLMHNGVPVQTSGYCSDVYTSAAIDYLRSHGDKPFFIYLSYNAPHTPLQVPREYYEKYKDIDPSEALPDGTRPVEMSENDKEAARKVYAMVNNIDDNIGRLRAALKEEMLDKNTLIIFMTDNGPQHYRYLVGLRGKKSMVYEGGVRVPCFFHFPEQFSKNKDIDRLTAHIDILPTIADLCGAEVQDEQRVDGVSFLSQCKDNEAASVGGERAYFNYWTRRSINKYHNMSVQKGNYKLVANNSYNEDESAFELFNLVSDPHEQVNIVEEQLSIAQDLRSELDDWYNEMVTSPNLQKAIPAIIGTKYEKHTVLNRNDAFGMEAVWNQQTIFAFWEVEFAKASNYDIEFHFFEPIEKKGQLKIQIGAVHYIINNAQTGVKELQMKDVFIPEVKGQLMAWYYQKGKNGMETLLPFVVEIKNNN